MVYQATQKEFDKLKTQAENTMKINIKSITKAEPKPINELDYLYPDKEIAELKTKITELGTTNRNIMKRIFELETKVEFTKEIKDAINRVHKNKEYR